MGWSATSHKHETLMTLDIDRHVNDLERDGYTILKSVIPPAEIEAARQAIDETLAAEESIGREYGLQSENLRMAFNAQAKHPYFSGLPLRVAEPMQVARRILGGDMFAHDVAIRVPMPTGQKDHRSLGGNLHADWGDFTVKPFIGGKHYALGIQSAWAITEFNDETGAPVIWPGSHQIPEIPPEEPEALPPGWIIPDAPAGSVVMWDASLWHTGGTNRSQQPRYSLIFFFQRWWVKGFNDAFRYISPEARAAMTEEERRVWGLEAGVPPNTHLRGMSPEQLAALTIEQKAVLNIAPY